MDGHAQNYITTMGEIGESLLLLLSLSLSVSATIELGGCQAQFTFFVGKHIIAD